MVRPKSKFILFKNILMNKDTIFYFFKLEIKQRSAI
jgi:hypothetical protein